MNDAIAKLEILLGEIREERRKNPQLLLQLYEVAAFIEATKAALNSLNNCSDLEKAMSIATDKFIDRVKNSIFQDPALQSFQKLKS